MGKYGSETNSHFIHALFYFKKKYIYFILYSACDIFKSKETEKNTVIIKNQHVLVTRNVQDWISFSILCRNLWKYALHFPSFMH